MSEHQLLFSRYCVDMCPLSHHCADRFCWFLAVSLINYPDMYGLIYQPLSRQSASNLWHCSRLNFGSIDLYIVRK